MAQPYMQPYAMPPMHYGYPDHGYEPRPFRPRFRPPPPPNYYGHDPNYYGGPPMPPRGMRPPRFFRPRFMPGPFPRRPYRPPAPHEEEDSGDAAVQKPLPRNPEE